MARRAVHGVLEREFHAGRNKTADFRRRLSSNPRMGRRPVRGDLTEHRGLVMTNAEQLDSGSSDEGSDYFHAKAMRAELVQLRDEVARLEASARMYEQRMALVVHELRQPLNVLAMDVALLAQRASGDEQ